MKDACVDLIEPIRLLSESKQRQCALEIARLIEPAHRFESVLEDLEKFRGSPSERLRREALWRALQPMAVSASIWCDRAPSPRHVHALVVAAATAWDATYAAKAVVRHAMYWAAFERTPMTSDQMRDAIGIIVAGPN